MGVLTAARFEIQVRAATRAQTPAILTADWLNGQTEQDVFTQKMIGVDPTLLDVGHVQFVHGEFALLPFRDLDPERAIQIEPILGLKAKRLKASAADERHIPDKGAPDQ
jgi:hypothetical protein